GYDELTGSKKEEVLPNLVSHLGLQAAKHAKLIVTCRPGTVKEEEQIAYFGFKDQLQTYHVLPFNTNQLLTYLQEQLSWDDATKAEYKRKLQDSKAVQEVLRNPFVLYLLRQSWGTLSHTPFEALTRWRIYEGSIRHAITTNAHLLEKQ